MTQGRFRKVKFAGILALTVLVLAGIVYSQDKLKAGIEAYKKGDYDQAIYLLNQHLSQIPYDYDGNFYLGNAYFQKKDWKEALRVYQKAHQKKAKPEVLYQLGLTCMELGDLGQAAKYAEEGIKSKGTKSEIGQMNYLLAKIQFQQKNYSEADKNLRIALAAEPNNSSFHKLLGDVNYERNVPSLAISEYNQALKLDPSLAEELHYRLGRAYFLNRQFDEALAQYKLAIQQDSSFADAYLGLGNLYYWGNKFSEALWAYEQYLRLKPGDPGVLLNLGKMYFLSRQYDQAIEKLSSALSAKPDREGVYWLAQSYQETKQYLEAEKQYAFYEKLVLDSEPGYTWTKSDAEFWFKRGVTNFYAGDSTSLDLSAKCFTKAAELDPENSEAYSYLGLIFYKQKQLPQAIDFFKKKIALDSSSYNTYTNLAYVYIENKMTDSAIWALEKSVELKPDNLKALGQLAWINMAEHKDFVKSGYYYEKIIQVDSTDCEAKGYLGLSYLMQKKHAAAIPYLREAVKCKPDQEQFNLWLAQAFALTGQKENARQYYRRVLQINPNNKDAKDGLQILEF
jgi:tetratricopeptide (TPR) repeat protein